MSKNKINYVFILIILMAVSISCAINPVTGKRDLMFYSEAAEINLGRQTDQQVRAMYGVYDDPALNDYVSKVGRQLVPHIHPLAASSLCSRLKQNWLLSLVTN
jgi:predicted Zn-dependent protease